jgi:hypothetical protein
LWKRLETLWKRLETLWERLETLWERAMPAISKVIKRRKALLIKEPFLLGFTKM